MGYKIAVGSSDGVYIDEHFATALQFLIYEVDGDNYEFIEKRVNEELCECSRYHENKFAPLIEKIKDCRVLLVGKIGYGAAAVLQENGIDSYGICESVDVALDKIVKYYGKLNNWKYVKLK